MAKQIAEERIEEIRQDTIRILSTFFDKAEGAENRAQARHETSIKAHRIHMNESAEIMARINCHKP